MCLKLRFCSEWELKNPSFSTFLSRRHVNEVSKLKPFKPVIDMVISQYLFRIYMFIFQDVLTLKLFNFISFINESYTSLLHYEKACDGVDAHYDDYSGCQYLLFTKYTYYIIIYGVISQHLTANYKYKCKKLQHKKYFCIKYMWEG